MGRKGSRENDIAQSRTTLDPTALLHDLVRFLRGFQTNLKQARRFSDRRQLCPWLNPSRSDGVDPLACDLLGQGWAAVPFQSDIRY